MNHPVNHLPFQLENRNNRLHSTNYQHLSEQDANEPYSKLVDIRRDINTGIRYLSLPEPRLQIVKPEQLSYAKNQAEQDFSIRFRHMSDDELNDIFGNTDQNDASRYIHSYHYLYQSVLASSLKCIDINEEISQIKHVIVYKNELSSILAQNHKSAKLEKRILYNIAVKTWKRFDECMQNETNVQHQLEQVKNEHQTLRTIKIKQEQYQALHFKLYEINHDLANLKKEVEQLSAYKTQLQNEIQEIKARSSHISNQLDFLKSNIIRPRTSELNNLQLERDSLLTKTALLKHDLLEQIQQHDSILKDYRTNLTSFYTTIHELEEEVQQQADSELSNLSVHQTIDHDTNKLILILENKINQRNSANNQLKKLIYDEQENIEKQKQLLIKKETDYRKMDHLNQEFIQNIHTYREAKFQLKGERRIIECQLKLKLKQYSNDDRLHHTLIEQHDALLARKKLEQRRLDTSNEHIYPLVEENNQLKTQLENLQCQYTEINLNNLVALQNKVFRLKKIYQASAQQKLVYEHTKNNYQKVNEQLHIKTNRIIHRINGVVKRMEDHNVDFKNNNEKILRLENKLGHDQRHYLQSQCLLTEIKNRSESYQTKQHFIETQIQVASNNIKHCQYRSKTFSEQLFMWHNDLLDQQASFNKLREFHAALKEQDEISSKKLSNMHDRLVTFENQYDMAHRALQQTNQDLVKYLSVRSILGRMVIRRVNLCQLVYRKLSRTDKNVYQQEKNIGIISKCINAIKIEIYQLQNQNRKLIDRRDKAQLETVKAHVNKMIDHTYEKQQVLAEKLLQRHFYTKYSLNPLPTENNIYLKNKYYILKKRLMKMICRGIICNYALLSIQQEFLNNLEDYKSKSNRKIYIDLNARRTQLYQLMHQLKAKTAENNMFIDYRYYIQLIHTDTIVQFLQWETFNSTDDV